MGSAVSSPPRRELPPPPINLDLACGDVIKAKVGALSFEGVVNAIDGDRVLVDFGDNDLETVSYEDCVKILAWQSVEVGDTVHVRESNGRNNYVARVIHVDVERDNVPRYSVDYGENDCEDGVPAWRVRKLRSERSTPARRWRKSVKAVMAAKAFSLGARSSNPPRSWKIGDVVRAKTHGGWIEGMIEQTDEDGCLVYFEQRGDSQWVSSEHVEKIMGWGAIEKGDCVQVKPRGEGLWFNATVVDVVRGRSDDQIESYTVRWEGIDDDDGGKSDDALETGVVPARIRKLRSTRQRAVARWQSAWNVTKAVTAFQTEGRRGSVASTRRREQVLPS